MKSSAYKERLVDERLKELLSAFGGVLITGPKWCGKSWTASNQANSEIYIDQKENQERALLLPDTVLTGATPRLIDEWQDAPLLWDAARRQIDKKHSPGLFIFTGSSMPPEEKLSHTGTGRFARLNMRPLSLLESGDSSGKISLGNLFQNGMVEPCPSEMDFKKAVHLICKGGWPASFWLDDPAAMLIPQEYIQAIAQKDISRIDGVKKDPHRVLLFLRSLARNTATAARASTLSGDVARDGGEISDQTTRSYLEALRLIYVIDEQEAWQPSLRSRTRIRTSPKRHFTDPSLAAAALGATPELLVGDLKTAGFLFESLCYRDLCVYADASRGKVFHYRDDSGLEADAIVSLPDGRWGAVECKLGSFEFDAAAENLIKLKQKLAGEIREPSFLAIVTATGGLAYTRDDSVSVVPLDCLGK
jgi:predicted AAA+ superfamily ATPase